MLKSGLKGIESASFSMESVVAGRWAWMLSFWVKKGAGAGSNDAERSRCDGLFDNAGES